MLSRAVLYSRSKEKREHGIAFKILPNIQLHIDQGQLQSILQTCIIPLYIFFTNSFGRITSNLPKPLYSTKYILKYIFEQAPFFILPLLPTVYLATFLEDVLSLFLSIHLTRNLFSYIFRRPSLIFPSWTLVFRSN